MIAEISQSFLITVLIVLGIIAALVFIVRGR